MTEEMKREMMEAMKTMKKICENSKFCKGCPFDKYCDYENPWDGGTKAIPANFDIEED